MPGLAFLRGEIDKVILGSHNVRTPTMIRKFVFFNRR